MAIEDYIRIIGDVTDTAPFQGVGGTITIDSVSSGGTEEGTGGTVSIYGNLEITDALWTAQNDSIIAQNDAIAYLQEKLGEEATGSTGITGILKDFGGWILQDVFLKQALAEILEKMIPTFDVLGEVGDDIADTIAEAFINLVVYIMDFFEKLADPGVQRCKSMTAENNAMLEMTKSPESYYLRKETLDTHQAILQELYESLSKSDEKLMQIISMIVDLLKGYISGDNDDEWDNVAETLETNIGNIETWMSDIETNDVNDLPVPVPPALPVPPSDSKNAMLKIAYLVAKYGLKFVMESYRRQRETDTHITDLTQAVKDLRYNDEEIDLGGVRVHLRNKLIEVS